MITIENDLKAFQVCLFNYILDFLITTTDIQIQL